MTDSNSNHLKTTAARRRILRTLLASGGMIAGTRALPEQWAKPVVESVILPAHAQGSVTLTPTPTPLIFTTRQMGGPGPAKPAATSQQSTAAGLLNMIIPPAEAEIGMEACAVSTFDLDFTVANPASGPVTICFAAAINNEVSDFQTTLASTNSGNAIADFDHMPTQATLCVGLWNFSNVAINGAQTEINGDVMLTVFGGNTPCQSSFTAALVPSGVACPEVIPRGCGLEQ